MRNAGPCTQIEVKMKPDDILVSRTDLKGRILYANKAFCDIAGFTVDELKGQAHNLVRHPDMPAAAFQDLWDTISVEKPWTGFVKNRCKNGDYYWVIANVSPEYDSHSKVSGYISVRTAPSQAQIDTAESFYRDVNAGKSKVPSTLSTSWIKKLKLKTVMLAAVILSVITIASLGVMIIGSLLQSSDRSELRTESLSYIESVGQVLELLPQHRGLGNTWHSGDKSVTIKLASLEEKVDSAMMALVEISEQSTLTAQLNQTRILSREWVNLKNGWKQSTAKQSFNQHSELIHNMIRLSSDLLYSSGIATDPAQEVVYLGVVISENIHELNDLLGRLRGIGAGAVASGSISKEQHDMISNLKAGVEGAHNKLAEKMAHVIRDINPTLGNTLSQPLNTLQTSINTFFHQVNYLLKAEGNKITLDSSLYFNQGTQVIDASRALSNVMLISLGQQLKEQYKAVRIELFTSFSLLSLGIIGTLILALLMMKKTFHPLKDIVEGMQRIVEGDFSQMPVKYAFDELGDIADDMKTMQSILQYEIFEGKSMAIQRDQEQKQAAIDKNKAESALADAFEENIGSLVTALAAEVHQVSAAAVEMDEMSDVLASQSESAMHGVDLGGSHVNSTAAAIEEMSVTITDVSRQVSDTQSVSTQAVIEAEAATQMMEKLTRVADEIGSIVGTISDIAEQTNLLALNASIEAARAGDAGRGFSVVAGEVKELANQTSNATNQIRKQVEDIQNESQQATVAINKISTTISDINGFTSTVAEAMQQQAEAGHEISSAAQQADISMNEARSAVDELANSAVAVDKSSDDMIDIANSMSERTEAVQQGINAFVETLRKA